MYQVFVYAGLAMLVLSGMTDDIGLAKILAIIGVGGIITGFLIYLIKELGAKQAARGLIGLFLKGVSAILMLVSLSLLEQGRWIEAIAGALLFAVLVKVTITLDSLEVGNEHHK